jgi:phosphatidate cytidylyltransferase
MFLPRLISSFVLWCFIAAMIFSKWAPGSLLCIMLCALLGQWEFYRAQEQKGLKVYKRSGVFCGFLLFAVSWYFLIYNPDRLEMLPRFEALLFILVIIGALVRLVVSGIPAVNPVISVALTLLGFFYVPYLFNYVSLIAFWPNSLNESAFVLLYLLAVTKFSDIGAYGVGMWIGKHKMIPRVSPGKTWEGFAGGMLASLAVSIALVHIFRIQMPGFGLRDAVILGVLLPLASVVGDLAESVVKRDAQIKDSGKAIPGIGGMLDLIDSILFTAPVLYFYLYFSGING